MTWARLNDVTESQIGRMVVCGLCEVIQVYEVLYFSGDEFGWKAGGIALEQRGPSNPLNETFPKQDNDSGPEVQNGSGVQPSPKLCGAVAIEPRTEGQREQAPGADPGEPLLPSMPYDDSLTSSDACIRLWIAAVLMDKERGDRLTIGECEILSLLGLEPSWVQRMIDKAPSPGKVCRPRFI